MNHNPGIIYETDTGEYALAVNREQHEAFEAVNKVCVHIFLDRLCTVPKLDQKGNEVMVLKSAKKLTLVGLND